MPSYNPPIVAILSHIQLNICDCFTSTALYHIDALRSLPRASTAFRLVRVIAAVMCTDRSPVGPLVNLVPEAGEDFPAGSGESVMEPAWLTV